MIQVTDPIPAGMPTTLLQCPSPPYRDGWPEIGTMYFQDGYSCGWQRGLPTCFREQAVWQLLWLLFWALSKTQNDVIWAPHIRWMGHFLPFYQYSNNLACFCSTKQAGTADFVIFCKNHSFSRHRLWYTVVTNVMWLRVLHVTNINLTSPFWEIKSKLKSNEISLCSMLQKKSNRMKTHMYKFLAWFSYFCLVRVFLWR